MDFNVFNVLSFWRCSHDFAWPRSTGDGNHAQVCRRCGAAYEYDWTEMRRKKRMGKIDLESRQSTSDHVGDAETLGPDRFPLSQAG